jgi:hypothetical protein
MTEDLDVSFNFNYDPILIFKITIDRIKQISGFDPIGTAFGPSF